MAKLNDLVEGLQAKKRVVKMITLKPSVGGQKENYGVWYKTGDDVLNYRTVSIWVMNKGTDNETAYFDGSKPHFATAPTTKVATFRDNVVTKIKDLTSSGKFVAAHIEDVNEDTKTAVVKTYSSTGEESKTVLYEKDGVLTPLTVKNATDSVSQISKV